jgi:chromosome segregation ATPase
MWPPAARHANGIAAGVRRASEAKMLSLLPLLVEPAMYIAIGFLAAALLSLPLFGVTHRRAERLTRQRLDELLPMSVKELEAEKDRLRAEHAVSAQRLASTLDDLKSKAAAQQIEIGRHSGVVARLKAELDDRAQAIAALEAREAALKQQLRTLDQEHALQSVHFEDARHALHDKEAELARVATDFATRSVIAVQQNVELARTRTEMEALEAAAQDDERERNALNARLARAHEETGAAGRQLADERRKVDDLTQAHAVNSALLDEARAALRDKEEELARLTADLVTGAAIIERQDLDLARARADAEALRLAAEQDEREREALRARLARHGDETDAAGRRLAEERGRMEHLAQDQASSSAALEEARAALREQQAELARLAADFATGAGIIEQQDLDLAKARAEAEALKLESEALRARLARHGDETDAAEGRLAQERGKAEGLDRRAADLEAELIAQREAADALTHITAARICEQARRLADQEHEVERLQAGLDAARRAEAGLRYELTRVEERRMLESRAALAEKAALEIQVARLQLDREQRQLEVANGTHAHGATNGHGVPDETHVVRLDPIVMRERRAREETTAPHPGAN